MNAYIGLPAPSMVQTQSYIYFAVRLPDISGWMTCSSSCKHLPDYSLWLCSCLSLIACVAWQSCSSTEYVAGCNVCHKLLHILLECQASFSLQCAALQLAQTLEGWQGLYKCSLTLYVCSFLSHPLWDALHLRRNKCQWELQPLNRCAAARVPELVLFKHKSLLLECYDVTRFHSTTPLIAYFSMFYTKLLHGILGWDSEGLWAHTHSIWRVWCMWIPAVVVILVARHAPVELMLEQLPPGYRVSIFSHIVHQRCLSICPRVVWNHYSMCCFV